MNFKFLVSLYPEVGCGDQRAEYLKSLISAGFRVRNLNWWEPKRVTVSVHVSRFWPKEPQNHKHTPAWVLWWDYSKWETKKTRHLDLMPMKSHPFQFHLCFPRGNCLLLHVTVQIHKKSFVRHDILFVPTSKNSLW